MSTLNTAGLIQSGWVRYAHAACAVLVLYEHFLQLDNEIELFWKKRWTLAKILFLWCRYFSLVLNITDAVVFLGPKPSHTVSRRFFHWQNAGAGIQVLLTHLILQLRLYAMYSSARKMLIFFIFLSTAETVILGVNGALGLADPKRITTNEPFPGVFICANGEPVGGDHWVVYFYITVLTVEGILLLLALRKAWQYRSCVGGSTLMQQLTRESAIYFFMIFWIYLANLIIWLSNRITLNELGVPFSFAFSSIFANRLLIGVRTAYYGTSRDLDDTYHTPIYFSSAISTISTRGRVQERIELQTFNERIGA
ncbi:hypothetical protein Hypma_011041 [Hypsizygus marmoreus]|uniref:DUF6533 domain-containing protein n=1 Tax=Hypsizygus marmoreus TaxID=39966 RepID=A0A369JIK9_HYPMA|nr:hypothetical protein Hypma_011041 [Hypsizygus marmoreus]